MGFLLPQLGDSQHITIPLDASIVWHYFTKSASISIAILFVAMYTYHLIIFARSFFPVQRLQDDSQPRSTSKCNNAFTLR